MTQQVINVGTVAGDNTGDPGRVAFQKVNANFSEIYSSVLPAGNSYADKFTATAGQTAFTLSGNPGSLNNLDVSLDGATLVPGVDYSWSSTTLTLTVGATAGQTLLARYSIYVGSAPVVTNGSVSTAQLADLSVTTAKLADLSVTTAKIAANAVTTAKLAAASVTATQLAASAVVDASLASSSQIYAVNQTYNRTAAEISASVTPTNYGYPPGNVLRYGADPTGAVDATTAFTNASLSNTTVTIPAGTFKLTNFRPQKSGQSFIGAGYGLTLIQQGATNSPAINCLSDVTTGQLAGMDFRSFKVLGSASATVAGFVVQATTPYVVTASNFDFQASSCYTSLQIVTTSAHEVYNCTFRLTSYSSTNVGFTCSGGVYNTYNLTVTGATNGQCIYDGSWNSVFTKAVSDGQQTYAGVNNVIINPTIESWTGTAAAYAAISITGGNNRAIGVCLTNVPNAKLSGQIGLQLNNNNISVLGYEIIGTQPATAPLYPIAFSAGGSGVLSDCIGNTGYKAEQYTAFTTLANYQFLGDCSALTKLSQQPMQFGPASPVVTGTTYTVDATFTSTGLDPGVIVAASATCTLTLPSGSAYIGRVLNVTTRNAFTVVSASSNVVSITGGAAGTAILAATAGKWATLKYDGTSWNIIASN